MRQRSVIFVRFFLFCGLTLAYCKEPVEKHSPAPTRLSQMQLDQLRRGADFLTGKQQADGHFNAGLTNDPDSAIAQTGYALRSLVALRGELGTAYAAPVERGRTWVVGRAGRDGLWKYKPFLPADLDDTTNAMTTLDRESPAQRALLQQGITSVLQLQRPNGEIPTWLMAADQLASLGEKTKTLRLADADAEVMAFFFEYIQGFDNSAYQKNIETAARFIAAKQERNGRWKTAWYHNDLYSTYRALRFFASQPGLSTRYKKHIDAGLGFISQSRLKDGTWGSVKSRILDTALCVGILGVFKAGKETEAAVAFLSAAQQANGGWPAEPFFFLDIQERDKPAADRKFIGNELYTTSIVVENLLLHYQSALAP